MLQDHGGKHTPGRPPLTFSPFLDDPGSQLLLKIKNKCNPQIMQKINHEKGQQIEPQVIKIRPKSMSECIQKDIKNRTRKC